MNASPAAMKPNGALDRVSDDSTLAPPRNVAKLFSADPSLKKLIKSLQPQRCRIVEPATAEQKEQAVESDRVQPADARHNSMLLANANDGWIVVAGFLILEISTGGFVALEHTWNALPSGTWIDLTPLAPSHAKTPRLLISSPLVESGGNADATIDPRTRRMLLHEPMPPPLQQQQPPQQPPSPVAATAPTELTTLSAREVEDAMAGVNAEGHKGHVRSGPTLGPLKHPSAAEGTAIEALKLCTSKLSELEAQHMAALGIATQAVQKVCGGRASVAQMGVVDGRMLVALDGVVPEALVTGARAALQERAAFRRVEQSSPSAPDQRHNVTDHDAAAFCATPLYERIALLVRLFFSGRGFTPSRIYTNAMQFGDVAHIHRDGNHEGVTALLYANEHWEPSLSGETMFFAEDEAARHAVLPKPGRLLLFVASIKHCGRPPSRLFWGQRLTLAVKFVAEQHQRQQEPGAQDKSKGRYDL